MQIMNSEEEDFQYSISFQNPWEVRLCAPVAVYIFLSEGDQGKAEEERGRAKGLGPHSRSTHVPCHLSDCAPAFELLKGKCSLQNAFLPKVLHKLTAERQKD